MMAGGRAQATMSLQDNRRYGRGRTSLNRSFAGAAWQRHVVNVSYRCSPPASSESGKTMVYRAVEAQRRPVQPYEEQFPRSKWV